MSTASIRTCRSTKTPTCVLPTKFSENPSFDYTIEKELGRGRFAKVCDARHKTSGNLYAAKISRRWRNGDDQKDEILREMEILKLASGMRHIVNVNDYYVDLRNVILLLERANGGDLHRLISSSDYSPPETYIKSIMRQLLEAVSFLHSNLIVHLDIKPENILLRHPYPDCDVVLCDLGLAKYLHATDPLRDLVGTPDYVAPEVLNYDPIHFTTDLWSVGVVAYFLLTGISPFWAATKEETLSNVCQISIEYPDELFRSFSPDAIPFMQRLIRKKPTDRPPAIDCINHEWLVGEDVSTPTDSPIAPDAIASDDDSLGVHQRIDPDRSFGE